MASLLIRNLDEDLKARLRRRAAEKGHSMEQEARTILQHELEGPRSTENLVDLAKRLFGREWGVDLEIEHRVPVPEPPKFDE